MIDNSPAQQLSDWLAALDAALHCSDAEIAATLFGPECYWRDLVTFTWNITTAEGRVDVRRMIEQAVIPSKPSGWRIDGEGSPVACGVTATADLDAIVLTQSRSKPGVVTKQVQALAPKVIKETHSAG